MTVKHFLKINTALYSIYHS